MCVSILVFEDGALFSLALILCTEEFVWKIFLMIDFESV
jgi:hypothetical protein